MTASEPNVAGVAASPSHAGVVELQDARFAERAPELKDPTTPPPPDPKVQEAQAKMHYGCAGAVAGKTPAA